MPSPLGSDLTDSPRSETVATTIHLDPDVWARLYAQASEILSTRRFSVDRDALAMAQALAPVLARHIPASQFGDIRRFRVGRTAALYIEGPAEPYPMTIPTPARGVGNDVDVQVFDALLLAVFHVAGFVPVAYEFENYGRLMRNVVADPAAKGQRSSHGFDEPLGFHTDNPCGEFERPQTPWTMSTLIPRVLGFISLRNRDFEGHPVGTEVLSLRSISRHCSGGVLTQLALPEFQINPPSSNGCGASKHVPLLEIVDGLSFLRFNSHPAQIIGLTKGAEWALGRLRTAILAAQTDALQFSMTPLSILLFDNYRMCHARRSFDPGDNLDRSRWLRRCYGLTSACSGRYVDRTSWPHVIR